MARGPYSLRGNITDFFSKAAVATGIATRAKGRSPISGIPLPAPSENTARPSLSTIPNPTVPRMSTELLTGGAFGSVATKGLKRILGEAGVCKGGEKDRAAGAHWARMPKVTSRLARPLYYKTKYCQVNKSSLVCSPIRGQVCGRGEAGNESPAN